MAIWTESPLWIWRSDGMSWCRFKPSGMQNCVNGHMNLQENFMASWESMRFSRRTLLHRIVTLLSPSVHGMRCSQAILHQPGSKCSERLHMACQCQQDMSYNRGMQEEPDSPQALSLRIADNRGTQFSQPGLSTTVFGHKAATLRQQSFTKPRS